MTQPCVTRWAALLWTATLATGAAAQGAPDDPNQPLPVPGQVLSDVEPLPAEARDSHGAVVLQDSLVRAQRNANAFSKAGDRTGVPSVIGRKVSRVLERARGWGEVRDAGVTEPLPDPALR